MLQDQSVRISVGTVGHLPDQVTQSYEAAKKAQEYFWIYPELSLIDYQELAMHQDNPKVDFSMIDWPAYAKLIIAKDIESLRACIHSDFKRIQALPGIMPHDFQNIAFEMVIHFKLEIKAIRHTEELEAYHLAFDQIREAVALEELEAAIRGLLRQQLAF